MVFCAFACRVRSQGNVTWAALWGGPLYLRRIVLARRLSHESPDRVPPKAVIRLHEVIRFGQHRPAVPLKPRRALAVQPRGRQECRSRERLLKFPPKAGDGAELHRLPSEQIERPKPVGGIDRNDDLRR